MREPGARCRSRGSILLADQGLGLGGPWHDLRIEQCPLRAMALPERDLGHDRAHARDTASVVARSWKNARPVRV